MYAVIFTATIKEIDDEYVDIAGKMESLAMGKYGCIDLISVTEGNSEITISYWPDLASIEAWKNDPEHINAQRRGKERWYSAYKVQVTRVEREYEG